VAYYAAWPVQAYIERFHVSNSIVVTYTHTDTEELEGWIDSNEAEAKGYDSNYTIVERKVTLKINGGTVAAAIEAISPIRDGLVLQERWEKGQAT